MSRAETRNRILIMFLKENLVGKCKHIVLITTTNITATSTNSSTTITIPTNTDVVVFAISATTYSIVHIRLSTIVRHSTNRFAFE